MIFEIINPSDKYTIEADDYKVVSVAGLLLGEGKYALKEQEGDFDMPMFLFGGAEDWAKDQFDCLIEDLVEEVHGRPGELIRCLESIVVGNREVYLAGLGGKSGPEKWIYWEKWQDENSSSMNDIGRYAMKYAQAIRRKQDSEREKQDGHQPAI